MARLTSTAHHSRSDRAAAKTPAAKPGTDSPKRVDAGDAKEADLDDVYQEPSRRRL
jgi:hypothetical protein